MTDNKENAHPLLAGWTAWGGNARAGVEDTYWHYTNAAGLLGILQSHELWATSPIALNDTAEVEYGRALISAELERAREHYAPDDFRRISMMVSPYLGEWGNGNVFLLSSSTDGDLLNQWHHYASTGGFAVGIRADATFAPRLLSDEEVTETEPGDRFPVAVDGWVEVEYDVARQKELIRSFFDYERDAPHLEESPRIARLMIAWADLYTLMCRLKDPRFSSEQEVRYLSSTKLGSHMEDFRLASGRIVPFVHLRQVDAHDQVLSHLPIEQIRIGPGNTADTERIVRRAAASNGYGHVLIDRSTAPLR